MINFINRNLVSSWGTHSVAFPPIFRIFFESGLFKYRLLVNATYFRYIDVILIFLHQNIKIEKNAEKHG